MPSSRSNYIVCFFFYRLKCCRCGVKHKIDQFSDKQSGTVCKTLLYSKILWYIFYTLWSWDAYSIFWNVCPIYCVVPNPFDNLHINKICSNHIVMYVMHVQYLVTYVQFVWFIFYNIVMYFRKSRDVYIIKIVIYIFNIHIKILDVYHTIHHRKPWVWVRKLSLQDERGNRWESPVGYRRCTIYCAYLTRHRVNIQIFSNKATFYKPYSRAAILNCQYLVCISILP